MDGDQQGRADMQHVEKQDQRLYACAAAFASAACGLCDFDTRIKLKFTCGGELEVICDRDMNVILNAEFSKDFSASVF